MSGIFYSSNSNYTQGMKQVIYSGYEEIPHTADLSFRVWSKDWPGLVNVSFQVTHNLLGSPRQDGQSEQIPFTVKGSDRLTTLIAFLNEMLFLFEQSKLTVDVQPLDIHEEFLNGTFIVKEIDTVYHQIKAVTFHGGDIQVSKSGLSVIVVYDL
jgi:SHS2 domain-containing protein